MQLSLYPNIMNKLNNMTSSFPASSSTLFLLSRGMTEGNAAASRHVFSLQNIQIFEIILAIAIFITIHSLRQKRYHGVPVWPIVGMLPSLALGVRKNLYEWLAEIANRQNGTFYFRGPWFSSLHSVITSDPRNLEHLLKTKFSSFPKGEYFRSSLNDFLGDGIFNADDEIWQKQRKTASVEFHSARFRQLTTESLLELVHKRLLPVLEEESFKKSVPIDLQAVLLRLTFDNVCMIAFGVDPGCLSLGLPQIPFAHAFEKATEGTVLRFVTPTCVWKAMRYLNIGMEKKVKESIKEVNKFADEVIKTRKEELASQDENSRQRSDLLTVFMRIKDDQGNPFSDKFLRDICINFILAGRDTSSVALSWFFWLIDQHPNVEEKILKEICKILHERGVAVNRSQVIFEPEEIKKMEYLQAAISEALRLYPSVPVDNKMAIVDNVFPDGTVLKKGTKVMYDIYSMGRMETIWGKDCREFKPERWLRDEKFVSESPYKFTAFNGGPRLCLGKDFAYYQMKFVAASLMYQYKVKVAKNHPVEPKLALTMYMKHGLKVNLIRRDEAELHKHLRVRY